MRISVLWSELSGYLNVCLRTLVEQYQVDLQVIRIQRGRADATFHPYADDLFGWIPTLYTLPDGTLQHYTILYEQVTRFQPDLLLISGWTQPAYLRLAKTLRGQGVRVICGGVDNQWQGTPKQWLGAFSAHWRVHPYFDALWVTENRAARLARRLGYTNSRLLTGFYACDYNRFAAIGKRRLEQSRNKAGWPQRFLFSGRLVAEKGILDLLTAYRNYRQRVANPWSLWVAGSGPLASTVQDAVEVHYLDFLQPDAYAEVLGQVGAFILPSHVEPWGVVLQEATCAALPVIASHQCGSADTLIEEGRNGFTFPAGDVARLTSLMIHLSQADNDHLFGMGQASLTLAGRYQPAYWAQTLWDYSQMGAQ